MAMSSLAGVSVAQVCFDAHIQCGPASRWVISSISHWHCARARLEGACWLALWIALVVLLPFLTSTCLLASRCVLLDVVAGRSCACTCPLAPLVLAQIRARRLWTTFRAFVLTAVRCRKECASRLNGLSPPRAPPRLCCLEASRQINAQMAPLASVCPMLWHRAGLNR